MSCRTQRSHRPKRYAVLNQDTGRWEFVQVAPIGHRENKFLQLLSHGHEMKEIAELMRVSLKTAQSFARDLQFKFQLPGLRKLFLVALDLYPRQQNRIRHSNQESSLARTRMTGDGRR
jgi:DNA-binding NarL/FixJ family response regulator